MRTAKLVVALVAPLLAGCSGIFGTDNVVRMQVMEARVPCMGVIPQDCLLTRPAGSAELQMLYQEIEGFVHEEGYRYTLRVSMHTIRNPPADGPGIEYRLERVESKERSPRHGDLELAWQREAQWREARPASYMALVERECYCAEWARGPVRVEVALWQGSHHERVVERRYAAGGALVTEQPWLFPGVEQLFGIIRRAIAEDVHELRVEYDPVLHYPRRVYIDPHANAVDDEVEYVIHEITAS
jgi:hypothetical protein